MDIVCLHYSPELILAFHPPPLQFLVDKCYVEEYRETLLRLSCSLVFSSVQSLSHVWIFATTWITARQASLSITISRSSLKLTSIKSVTPSSHLILCRPFSSCPQSLPASESFPMSQLFTWGGQSNGVSALASVLPKNIQGWSPLEWTGCISLQSKGLSRVFSNTTVQKHQLFSDQLSSLIIREMQIKTMMRTLLTLVRMAIIRKTTNSKCKRGCQEKGTLHYWCNCKFVQPLWKTV